MENTVFRHLPETTEHSSKQQELKYPHVVMDDLNQLLCYFFPLDSPGTTAGSTWDHQTAYPLDSPYILERTPACCDFFHTVALPKAPVTNERVTLFSVSFLVKLFLT